jgi:hypothetical protein
MTIKFESNRRIFLMQAAAGSLAISAMQKASAQAMVVDKLNSRNMLQD